MPWYPRFVRFSWLALAFALSATLPAIPATAQSANELNAARRLYQQGVRHVRAGRWQLAREALERSLAIAERPATMLNLAGALVETGSMVAGAEMYRRYLRAAENDRHRESTQSLLAELEERMPNFTLVATGLGEEDRLFLDGAEIGRGIMGIPVPVDPGDHEITVMRDGDTIAAVEFVAEEGEESPVSLRAPEPEQTLDLTADPVSAPIRREDEEGSGGILSSPIFWVVTILLIGAGVAIGVVLATSGSDDGYLGNVGDGRLGI
jgi:hypothetical protein